MITTERFLQIKNAIKQGRAAARAGGITVTVEQSDKLGYDWHIYAVNRIVVRKEYVAQKEPVGTADNPIVWKDGATAYPNFCYIKDGVRKVWTGEAWDMPQWDDERFVEL
jgi:hypothetical protein